MPETIVKVMTYAIRGEPHELIYEEHAEHLTGRLLTKETADRMKGRTKAFFYAQWIESDQRYTLGEEAPPQPW